MPRVSKEQAALNRQHIVEVAARLYRQYGLNGIGVADLMAEAGVTHGGFYVHFASKDALAAEACGLAFENSARKWNNIIQRHPRTKTAALQEIVNSYLSKPDPATLGNSCPIPALATDAMRQERNSPLRLAFTNGMRFMVDCLQSLLPVSFHEKKRRERAIVTLSLMVGAMTLARASADESLTDEILSAADKALMDLNVNRP